MIRPVVLSYLQTTALLDARRANRSEATTSADLGRSSTGVGIAGDGVLYPDGTFVTWDAVAAIAADHRHCYTADAAGVSKVQRFSPTTNRLVSLWPTASAPALLLSGVLMHRVKGIDPHRDTRAKIAAVLPLTGPVLDTSTGLGYTAIEAAKRAPSVVTIELDPVVVDVAAVNPWSRELFESERIEQIVGDSVDVIKTFDDDRFAVIIHDPPVISLAGDLYSSAYYRQLYRLLRRGGRLLHYIGDLASTSGARTSAGVRRRLLDVGFVTVTVRPEAFAVMARK